MARNLSTGILVLVAVVASVVMLSDGFPTTMTLKRAFPVSQQVEMSRLIARDKARHGRILQSTASDVVDFPVDGTFNPFTVGLYYTTVQLGSPSNEFYVQIDTGSDVLWVSCSSCSGCPSKSGLNIPMNSFNSKSSSSASEISCSDERCTQGTQSSDATCTSSNNLCGYTFQYGDGSTASGYYVSDKLYFDNTANSSSASVVFGCSSTVTGQLTKTERAVDGIFGFGQQSLSVISQLASQGVTPNAFSHCLKGDDAGGGVLVLGEILEPNMIYTPLASSQSHYNLNLQSISVNGQALNIDSSVFATSTNGGTIIDSGTTLAYLAEEAYSPFVNAIDAAVSQSAQQVPTKDNTCYLITSSVADVFPNVTLNFEGNASMVLGPQDYLLQQGSADGAEIWCIGFDSLQGGLTILGDLVLKDKIIVYDIAGQRIGWSSYNCSLPVNVSTTTSSGKTETVSGRSSEGSSSTRTLPGMSMPWIVTAGIIYYTWMLCGYILL